MGLRQAGVLALLILLVSATLVFADYKVLVIPKGSKAVFWDQVLKGAVKAGKDLDIRVTFRSPYTEDQYSAQSRIIEYGIQENFDAIVLAPNHSEYSAPLLKNAVAKGIKVVLIDSGMNASYHVSIIESDNYRAGQLAAEHLGKLINGKGSVVLGRHMEHHRSTHEREQGFLDTISSRYPEIKVVAAPYVGESVGTAYHITLGLFERFTHIDAFFSVSEESTMGILQALKERENHGKTRFVGFDFNVTIRNAIVNHEMDATIVQNAFQIGYLGVKTAYKSLQGKRVPERLFTDIKVINRDTLFSDDAIPLIQPYLEKEKQQQR